MKNYKKNLKILEDGHVYSKDMEHDACGVGLIASTEGKKSRKVVEYGINALKAVGIEELLMLMEKQVMEPESIWKFLQISLLRK